MIRRFTLSPLLLALLLTIPAILPLAAPGYFFHAHDGYHSVFFLVEFDQVIRDGVLWPVWSPDHALGFGYPLWLVYAPLTYYVAEAFHLLGLGYTVAVKATWALLFLVGAIGTYRLARRWWGPAAAVTAALAYTYAPYHLVQIYVRAALAEFAALAWIPWLLLAFVSLCDAPGPRRAALAALAFAALLLIHTVSALIFVPLLGAFLLLKLAESWRKDRTRRPAQRSVSGTPSPAGEVEPKPPYGRSTVSRSAALWSLAALALGGLLASIFWLPMFLERGYIVEAQWVNATYDYSRHFVYPSQFFDPDWGYGYSVPGPADGLSFQLGLLIFVGASVGAVAALRREPRPAESDTSQDMLWPLPEDGLPHRLEAVFFVGASLVAIFLMTPAARLVWDTLPLVKLIQFPWRLLAVATLTLPLLAGAGVHWLERRTASQAGPSPYAYLLALAIVLASFPFTRPELQPIRSEDESPVAIMEFELQHPDMRGVTLWSERQPANEDSPLLPQYLAGESLDKAAIVAGSGSILEQAYGAASAYARVRVDSNARLRFYTYYFPGWRATVDGRPVEIAPDPPNGLIGLDLAPGEHEVRLRFGATPVRRTAAGVSLFALACVAVLLFVGRRRVAQWRSASGRYS